MVWGGQPQGAAAAMPRKREGRSYSPPPRMPRLQPQVGAPVRTYFRILLLHSQPTTGHCPDSLDSAMEFGEMAPSVLMLHWERASKFANSKTSGSERKRSLSLIPFALTRQAPISLCRTQPDSGNIA